MQYDYEFEKPLLTKAIVAGVFTGIMIAVINLVYNYIYRDVTGFSPSEIFNVSSIIFCSVLISLVAGIIYFLFAKFIKKGGIIFTVLFVVLTILGIISVFNTHRSSDAHTTALFRGLYLGIIIVTGFLDSFMIPYFSKHSKFIL